MTTDNEKLILVLNEAQETLRKLLPQLLEANPSIDTLHSYVEAIGQLSRTTNTMGDRYLGHIHHVGPPPEPTDHPLCRIEQRLDELCKKLEAAATSTETE